MLDIKKRAGAFLFAILFVVLTLFDVKVLDGNGDLMTVQMDRASANQVLSSCCCGGNMYCDSSGNLYDVETIK
jgi:hypothetical protein